MYAIERERERERKGERVCAHDKEIDREKRKIICEGEIM